MRKPLLLTVCAIFTLMLSAQVPGVMPGGRGGQNMNIGRFYGKIVDDNGKGLDAASVQLIQSKFDTVLKKRKDTVIAGMLTSKSGDFSLENLPLFGNFRLKVSAIGFKNIEQKVAFEMKPGQGGNPSQAMSAIDKDLGNLKLEVDPKLLEAVMVTGSKGQLELGIDRKVFNVEKNITSAGGTAVDVMRNVPSLNVDVDGNVTLRNSAPQIFVDGRPTTLSLDQIPADAIQSVELITNPSAKYDASGGQSGILNIVLKKNRKTGYNGSIRTGIDSRAKASLGGDLNVRQGKINAFVNAMYNQRKSKSWGETEQQNFIVEPSLQTIQKNNSVFNGAFAFTRFGIDYLIDNRNTLTLSQAIVGGDFNFDNRNNSVLDTVQSLYETQYRNTLGKNSFRNYGSQISFKHIFVRPGKEWTADVNFNRSKNTNDQSVRYRSFFDWQQQNPKAAETLQDINGGGENKFLIAQTDYVNPVNEKIKWESGLRAQIRSFESSQLNYFNGVFNPSISNNFKYKDYVYAGYVTYSQKVKETFSYQVGLRAESSRYDGEQLGKASYSNNFPISLFPSVFLTKQFKKKQDLQLNYTRRINRPNFFQLMPNTDYSDPLNYQTGNPDLKPEFTHSLEMSYMKTYGQKNNSFLLTVFGKYTDNLIARYQRWQLIKDPSDSAFVATYVNASTAYAAGLELVFRNSLAKWWDLNYNVNFYYSKINGSNVVPDLKNERNSWFAKFNNTFKVAKGWSIQLSGDYKSKSALPVSTGNSGGGGRGGGGFMGFSPSTTQGYVDANYGFDLGVRKDFQIKKNTLTLSVNWNDFLKTREYKVHSEATGFIQDDWRRRDPQVVRINLSYRFGKFDVSLFKRKNLRGEAEGLQNGMQGIQQ